MTRKYRINIGGEERLVEVTERGEREYLIVLEGTTYEARIEEVRSSEAPSGSPRVSVSPAPPKSPTARTGSTLSKPNHPAQEFQDAFPIESPLTGTVTSIKVAVGAKVERNQALCILETMKMEIEVLATHDAIVSSIAVKAAQTVRAGDLLFVLQA
jgi:biotin carboxyl carrier protein